MNQSPADRPERASDAAQQPDPDPTARPGGAGQKRDPATATPGGRRRFRGPLDVVEWIGNKLPDPAVLFLLGAVAVLFLSHVAAPDLPEGYEVRWEEVGNTAAGGVDEHLGRVGRVELVPVGPEPSRRDGDAGEPAAEREDAGPRFEEVFTPGEFAVARTAHGLQAHLVLETGETVLGEDGSPIDFSERGWAVFRKVPVQRTDVATGETRLELEPTDEVTFARSLLTSEGLYWVLSSMEANFLGFAPLGVVLLGMLGIGPMERVGLISAALRASLSVVPPTLLTPAMVFLGVMSSLGSDAGYVVLPPLAAMAYAAVGRSPLAGIAAVFAGVSAGFNANLLLTSLEPLMAELTQEAARQVDPTREVAATSTWYFLVASTFVITFVGWATTALFVEKRLAAKPARDGGPDPALAEGMRDHGTLDRAEARGLAYSGLAFLAGLAVTVGLVLWEGSPLNGADGSFPRWVAVIVPLMFMLTIVPAMVYGGVTGAVTNTKNAAKTMIDSMAAMAPIIVLAFFAGQFVAYFAESNLGEMLAFTGGEWLFERRLPGLLLVLAFIGVTMVFNLFVGSMSAKYALFAPIFVPMFMLIGIRPELTMIAYRIGDSTTNIITPLNAYLVIILVYMQRYAPRAGIGTLIAMMLPYTVAFSIAWAILLIAWETMGLPLGPGDLGVAMTP